MGDEDAGSEGRLTGVKGQTTQTRVRRCLVDCCAHWIVYWLCGVLCCAVGTWTAAVFISTIPFVGVTDQPQVAEDYERLDLASLRYILLEGELYFPPPPPHPPW